MKKLIIVFMVGFLMGSIFMYISHEAKNKRDVEIMSIVLLHDLGLFRKLKSGHINSMEDEYRNVIVDLVDNIGKVLPQEELDNLYHNPERNNFDQNLYEILEMAAEDVDFLNSEDSKIVNKTGIKKIIEAKKGYGGIKNKKGDGGHIF